MSLKSRDPSFYMIEDEDNSTPTFNLRIPLKDGILYDFVFNLPIDNENKMDNSKEKENRHKDYAILQRIKVIPFDNTKNSKSRRKSKTERRACNLASHQIDNISYVA